MSVDDALEAAGLDPAQVRRIVAAALDEDLGEDRVDVTGEAIFDPADAGVADVTARAEGVAAGLAVAQVVFDALGPVEFTRHVGDGERVRAGDVLATASGPVRLLLAAERTVLNLLSRMSGVATHTRRWADLLAGYKTTVLDTRKTTPGLRILDKYAVRVGGGVNKRMGLFDVAMIKDNHKLAAGSVAAAYRKVRAVRPDVAVQVEVDTVAEAKEAVSAGADFLLCDNMTPDQLREVVQTVGDSVRLEATGNVTLDSAAEYAAAGVDYISAGALTHSSPILDIALDFRS